MPTQILFPYQYSYLTGIGKTFVPIIPIKLKTDKGFVEFNFIVDTGADLTTLPFFMAKRVGVDLRQSRQSTVEGIGGYKVKTWIVKVDLYFEVEKPITVRASITNENSTPFLLGRVDLLDVLQSWHFDSRQKKIIFENI